MKPLWPTSPGPQQRPPFEYILINDIVQGQDENEAEIQKFGVIETISELNNTFRMRSQSNLIHHAGSSAPHRHAGSFAPYRQAGSPGADQQFGARQRDLPRDPRLRYSRAMLLRRQNHIDQRFVHTMNPYLREIQIEELTLPVLMEPSDIIDQLNINYR